MINADKPHLWKADVRASVDMYNEWFMRFAPEAYRSSRLKTTETIREALIKTEDFRNITPADIRANPSIIQALRMATAPPIARDRLVGLADTTRALVERLESGKLPSRLDTGVFDSHLSRICSVVDRLLDRDLFEWLKTSGHPSDEERNRAATVVADRLCGALADPIVRNAQEARQLAMIEQFLVRRGYSKKVHLPNLRLQDMQSGTFSFRMGVVVRSESGRTVNIPIDAVIMPNIPPKRGFPVLIEAKSAGDYTNPNKRRKEEATKVRQLKHTYGEGIELVLFLCGYFDGGYLGYEAMEGLDWVWEHRIGDLTQLGI